ncbi:MAG: hypothetical protein RL017_337, partial [Pseudomonadota bacterium]
RYANITKSIGNKSHGLFELNTKPLDICFEMLYLVSISSNIAKDT